MSPLFDKILRAIASSDLPLPPPLSLKVPDLVPDQIRNRVCTALQSLQIRGEIEGWAVTEVRRDSVSFTVQDVSPSRYEELRFGLQDLQEMSVVLDVMES